VPCVSRTATPLHLHWRERSCTPPALLLLQVSDIKRANGILWDNAMFAREHVKVPTSAMPMRCVVLCGAGAHAAVCVCASRVLLCAPPYQLSTPCCLPTAPASPAATPHQQTRSEEAQVLLARLMSGYGRDASLNASERRAPGTVSMCTQLPGSPTSRSSYPEGSEAVDGELRGRPLAAAAAAAGGSSSWG
jgi:hypothetical protein